MNNIDKIELYKKAIQEWGKFSQMDMMIEESSELILACASLIHNMMKLSRAKKGKKTNMVNMQICEEIADLEIMLEQSHMIFDGKLIDKIKERKLKNLSEVLSMRKLF